MGVALVTTDGELATRARRMRRALTPGEAVLWLLLRTPPLKIWHFRRQVAFPPRYIADFCSHAARMVVEADGEGHVLGHARDALRDAWFAAQGYRVLRFENAHILADRDAVFRQISALIAAAEPPPRADAARRLSTLPARGREFGEASE